VLALLLGLAAGYGFYKLLHVEIVHELVSEQVELNEERTRIISGVMAFLFILTFRSALSGSEPGEVKKRGPLGIFLHFFNRGVDYTTNAFTAIVRLVITRRLFTMLVVGCFAYGILFVNSVLPSG